MVVRIKLIFKEMRSDERENMGGMRESDIVRQILEYMRWIGAYAGKTKTQGTFDSKRQVYRRDPYTFVGFPDLAFFYKNTFGFIEVKSAKGVQSDFQKEFQKLCILAHVPYVLARNVEDVQRVMEAL